MSDIGKPQREHFVEPQELEQAPEQAPAPEPEPETATTEEA